VPFGEAPRRLDLAGDDRLHQRGVLVAGLLVVARAVGLDADAKGDGRQDALAHGEHVRVLGGSGNRAVDGLVRRVGLLR
jgi:hypothetical protein